MFKILFTGSFLMAFFFGAGTSILTQAMGDDDIFQPPESRRIFKSKLPDGSRLIVYTDKTVQSIDKDRGHIVFIDGSSFLLMPDKSVHIDLQSDGSIEFMLRGVDGKILRKGIETNIEAITSDGLVLS